MGDHSENEARSLRYHEEIARRLRADISGLSIARRRVQAWREQGSVAEYYVEGWREILDQPLAEVVRFLTDTGEKACAFRQVSPFAGLLTPRERWAIWREMRRVPDDDASAA